MRRDIAAGAPEGEALSLAVTAQHWPIRGHFTIARGSKREAVVVVVELGDGSHIGRGECVPYSRYGESVDGVVAAIEGLRATLDGGLDRAQLARLLPAGAARNAVDCALWDLAAKRARRPAHELAGLPAPHAVPTAFTISLGDPGTMARQAREATAHPLLKLKLGGDGDRERLAAVRAVVPDARLIVDANEAWGADETELLLVAAADARVELVEQPLPAGADAMLAVIRHPIPICADESAHDTASLDQLAFSLLLVRLCGCLTCYTHSYRALRGCTLCATQTVRRFRGADSELLRLFQLSRSEVVEFEENGQPLTEFFEHPISGGKQ